MNKTIIFISVLIALVGLFLIGNSITGMIISQSCCTGDLCDDEYMCDFARPITESNNSNMGFGAVIMVSAVSLYIFTHKRH
ncbi:MAG: hypothetical protein KAQ83_02605 [Nanoarchaeota archaeon]|nr:hypothetical protein [Nanoarchaeota archaeon]